MAKGIHNERYKGLMERLAAERAKAGLSQAELAARLNRHQTFVSKYEAGERRLDVVEFLEVAEALAIDGIELLRSA